MDAASRFSVKRIRSIILDVECASLLKNPPISQQYFSGPHSIRLFHAFQSLIQVFGSIVVLAGAKSPALDARQDLLEILHALGRDDTFIAGLLDCALLFLQMAAIAKSALA